MILMSVFCDHSIQAQKKLQVVTKTIKKNLNSLDSGIVIEGQKANVEVMGWSNDYIQVELELISKHEKLSVAEKELEFIQYGIIKNEDHYLLKNLFYKANDRTRIRGYLSVNYRLFVPESQKVLIRNSYGSLGLNNLYGEVDLDLNFCEADLERLFGTLIAQLEYSDISGNALQGQIDIVARKSEIILDDLAGEVKLESAFGNLKLKPSRLLQSMAVKSRSGRVDVEVTELDAFNYEVRVNDDDIYLPEAQIRYLQSIGNGAGRLFKLSHGLEKANIIIENQLEAVSINTVQTKVGNER